MTRSTTTAFMFGVALVSITAALADRLGPGTYDLSWHAVGSGGGSISGGAFEVNSTIGQPHASMAPMTGGTYSLSGGFWPGAPVRCDADIVGTPGAVNIDDLFAVINGWGACASPCPPHCAADIVPPGGNCVVNIDDLFEVINHWGVCPQ